MPTDLEALRKAAGFRSQLEVALEVGVTDHTWRRWVRRGWAPKWVEDGLRDRAKGRAVGVYLVPVLGQVPAGPMDFAHEHHHIDEHVEYMPRRPGGTYFALRVRGQSMGSFGIDDGDTIIVRQQDTADPFDVVVARIDDEATVKQLRYLGPRPELHGDGVRLVPEDPRRLKIVGVVIEVRKFFGERG